jgi:pyrroloquinoline quinone (PQQ) biosynthesis protein C
MDFWDRLAAVAAERNVLEHPFYTRWSDGSLTREELAVYSGQYRHAVVALAAASRGAAPEASGTLREHLEDHAAEEHAHVELWDRFVAATGGDAGAEPSTESADCAAAWEGRDRDVVSTLVALYAIESAQPKIAEVKQQGLVELYGFEEGPATDYFEIHATLDHDHAEAHRAFIEPALDGADEDVLLDAAREVLDANWKLLDGVERLNT